MRNGGKNKKKRKCVYAMSEWSIPVDDGRSVTLATTKYKVQNEKKSVPSYLLIFITNE